MQILLSCAKTMGQAPAQTPYTSVPRFQADAESSIRRLMQLSPAEVAQELKVNAQIAAENVRRYAEFFAAETPQTPALLAYTGIVFQQMGPADFSAEDFDYAQRHLFITSFLYGLLRPLDLIRPYRLEGNTRLPPHEGLTRFEHWREPLTNCLIRAVKADDGVLVNLASAEMKRLFDWRRVTRELKVITPDFRTVTGDRERSIVVYTKMSRGQMARHLLKHRTRTVSELAEFVPDIPGAAVIMKMS